MSALRPARIAAVVSIVLLAPALYAGSARGEERELLVAAAVSLRDPLIAIAHDYEAKHPGVRVFTTFGASSAMAAQLGAGAPIDVFLSANRHIVDELVAEAQVDATTRFTLVRNRLVLLVANDARGGVGGPEDLLGPGIRSLAIPEPAVPLGSYAREWLRRRGWLAALEARIVSMPHARATLAAVESGHADAAVVYVTDARVARRSRIAWEIPEEEQPEIAYEAVQVADARNPERAASFLAHLRNGASLATLRAAGFTIP